MVRWLTIFALCLVFRPTIAGAEFRLGTHNYDDGPFTKFSDWIPSQLHQVRPRFVEDFYRLFSLPTLYDEFRLRRNIYFLSVALDRRFRHPRQALCHIQNEEQYHKYRLLMHMQIHLTIMRSYTRLASLFDKRHLYFYNLDFADDLEKSFEVAAYFYDQARPHWQKARALALKAHRYPFEIDLPHMESHRFEIATGKLDFEKIIDRHQENLAAKQKTVQDFLDREGRPRPVKKWMADVDDPATRTRLEESYDKGLREMRRLQEKYTFPDFP